MGKGRHQLGLEPWEVETIYSLVTWRPSQLSVCIPREVGGRSHPAGDSTSVLRQCPPWGDMCRWQVLGKQCEQQLGSRGTSQGISPTRAVPGGVSLAQKEPHFWSSVHVNPEGQRAH